MTHPERSRVIRNTPSISGPVVYWMSRDQRVRHNWAMLFAAELAERHRQPLFVVFNVVPSFPEATLRHYDFMLRGLMEVESDLRRLGVPFFATSGEPGEEIPRFLFTKKAGALVVDFSPLKISRTWKNDVYQKTTLAFFEVDAHNIVPCRTASAKQEYSARTLRPKINGRLTEFLTNFPEPHPAKTGEADKAPPVDWERLFRSLRVDRNVLPVPTAVPGEKAAQQRLSAFAAQRLDAYDKQRNDPNANMVSELSPYLHFGQISAQHVALTVQQGDAAQAAKDAFLEELIVRRELSENFCFHNERYDSLEGIPQWAKETLDRHRADPREYIYEREAFDTGSTHDPLWNAAQLRLRQTGRMHGYMRMYWAKKILEWSVDPETAFDTALHLNDRYALDGRDPNGYTGVAWSIGGLHDRPWFERPVFGKIRYMNYNGCARKFDTDRYMQTTQAVTDANTQGGAQ